MRSAPGRALTAAAPPRERRLPARGVVWRCSVAAVAITCRSRSAGLLFVVYGRKTTRINGNHEWLTSNVIGWWTNKYEIYWQLPRTVGR
jgi:hypothetical protein